MKLKESTEVEVVNTRYLKDVYEETVDDIEYDIELTYDMESENDILDVYVSDGDSLTASLYKPTKNNSEKSKFEFVISCKNSSYVYNTNKTKLKDALYNLLDHMNSVSNKMYEE